LMSVDDVIASVIQTCEDLGVADNTYFFYSSDHGFQLGNFNIPMDKRHVYDWDTRIHLLARGPGIKPNSLFNFPATQVDLAPTWLGLAGLEKPPTMDGKSLLPLMLHESDAQAILPSTKSHLSSLGNRKAYTAAWRDAVFIEYYFVDENDKCMADCTTVTPESGYPNKDSSCGDLTPGKNDECWGGSGCDQNCYATESTANNFIAVRHMPWSTFGDTLYVEYETGQQITQDVNFSKIDFIEYFNATVDPWMMKNLHPKPDMPSFSSSFSSTSSSPILQKFEKLHEQVQAWFHCEGDACP